MWAADRVDQMKERLARVGATDVEIAEFTEDFVNDDEWDLTDKERVWALNDKFLREEVLAHRAASFATTDDEDEAIARARDRIALNEELAGEAADAAQGTVAQVMEWVGDDDARAAASLHHETQCAEPRKSLIKQLRAKRASLERA